MKYYKVVKTIEHTEVYYVEAESEQEAFDNCDSIEPIINNDDRFIDDTVTEITKDQYESHGE